MLSTNLRGWWIAVAVTALLTFLGCGGGGGNAITGLVGKPAGRAVVISGNQATVAMAKYVLPLLDACAPAASPFHSSLSTVKTHTPGLLYVPTLNLYSTESIKTNTLTVSYFKDAAGQNPAGNMTATIEGQTNFTKDYSVFPVTVKLTTNVTAGNLPSNGFCNVVFTDLHGSNTLKGDIKFPRSGTEVILDMSLDASGNVGGSIVIKQSGLTITIYNLHGKLTDTLTGDVRVDPLGFTGTATINLLAGTFSISLNLPAGLSLNAGVDDQQKLSIAYSDGTKLSIDNGLTAPVDGPPVN